MSRIEEMIRDLCPEGVKRMTLGEVCLNCYAGGTPSTSIKDYWENGTIPWMSSGEVNLGQVYDVEKRITQLGYNNSSTKMVPANSVVIALAGQGKTRGLVAITRIELCTNQSLCALIPNTDILSAEYLYMYLQTQYLKLREVSSGDGTRGGLNLKMIKAYPIPVPPLPVQEKITKFFEKFSLLSAELEAELEGRRKQYDFYRNRLLSFDSGSDSVQWKTLGEVCTIATGSKPQVILTDGNYAYINAGTVESGRVNEYNSEKNAVTTPSRGQGGIGFVGFQKDNFWCGPLCYKIYSINPSYLNVKFLYYEMCTLTKEILSFKCEGGVPALNRKDLQTLSIPIPPLAEQERIVKILDKFEALVTDLSAGLPAEIERVQKQYEYYRNKLLTFPEV